MLRFALLRGKTRISIPKTLASSGSLPRPHFFCSQSHRSSIVRDLTDTHGFPPEAAETLAVLIDPKWRMKYPSVLALFRNYGFDHSDISSILIRQPSLLNASADNMLKPKLDALACLGMEGPTLVQVVTRDPFILRLSASLRLVPCLQCLYRFFGSTERLVDLLLLQRGAWILRKFTPNLEGNINILRQKGVPDASIMRLMLSRPMTLCRDPADFQSIITEVQELGMDAKSSMFIYGLITRAGMKKDRWASKVDVFKRFGWMEREVAELFVKQPKVMDSSAERIAKSLEYYLNQLGWTREDIMTYPSLLFISMHRRIIPRMSVLSALANDGSITKKGVLQALLLSNKNFMAKYMAETRDQTRHVLDATCN
ncbi:hypothetical protein MLD38_009867 [Melastoma candidum]|uniref:Uncharacterized protein n=1 Tax=Melastoma candidum TaxID=119954 RepID=A0ACB9RYU8_9MYRT|nr:hypothetical protein MLD38_009867 [Melastoma candidum]